MFEHIFYIKTFSNFVPRKAKLYCLKLFFYSGIINSSINNVRDSVLSLLTTSALPFAPSPNQLVRTQDLFYLILRSERD